MVGPEPVTGYSGLGDFMKGLRKRAKTKTEVLDKRSTDNKIICLSTLKGYILPILF